MPGGRQRWGPGCAVPWYSRLILGTWNITSLVGKEPELVREVQAVQARYRWAHLYVQHWLWNQTPREGLDSLLFWSCLG